MTGAVYRCCEYCASDYDSGRPLTRGGENTTARGAFLWHARWNMMEVVPFNIER